MWFAKEMLQYIFFCSTHTQKRLIPVNFDGSYVTLSSIIKKLEFWTPYFMLECKRYEYWPLEIVGMQVSR
jgi:hypothetical protein